MRFPKSVTILGRKFAVKLVTTEKLIAVTGQRSVGALDFSGKTIYILKDLSRDEQFLTLYHEVAHAVQSTVGLDQITSPELAEIWCESMANGFMDLAKIVR